MNANSPVGGEPTSANPLPVSVIIPTYMRERVLWQSLEPLRPQMREGDEILVVDQNHPGLQAPPDSASWLRLCRLDKPSLTRARNLGLAEARNPHVIFLDDDILPDPRLLDAFKEAALAHPGCLVTGQVEQADAPADVESPGSVDLRNGLIRTNYTRPLSGETPFFPGGLCLIPKACLPPAPCFRPAFRGAAQGEEIDFALRVRARGVKIHSHPSVRIYHLKAVEGGCRAPEFQRRFFLDHVFNQALFFGLHGRLWYLPAFFRRLRGFAEFHTRRVDGKGHARGLVLLALGELAAGLVQGVWLRCVRP